MITKIVYAAIALSLVVSSALAAAIVPASPAMAQGLPSAPTLLSPVDTMVDSTSVTFEWAPVSGATSYLLCVNDIDWPWEGEREFSGNVGLVTSHEVTGLPNDGTTFYWWVWAFNDDGQAPWAEVQANHRSFLNGNLPPAPTLLSPVETRVIGTSVTFTWEPVSGATSYLLCVNDVDWPWEEEREFAGNVGDVTSHEVTGLANDGRTYYWWVWGFSNGGQSPWAEVQANHRSFLNGNPPPPAPTLLSPVETTVAGTSVTFTWESVSVATSYWLCVNDVDDPWEGTREFTGNIGLVTSYEVTGLPNDGRTFYWWAWAFHNGSLSPWAEVQANHRSFISGNPPPAPTLLSPGNGTTVCGTSITFEWEPVPGATSYLLCVNAVDDPWEGTREFSGNVGLVTSHEVTGLPNDGTTFYWWVWAYSDNGQSRWIDVQMHRHLFINGDPPPAPTLVSPGHMTAVGGTSITFEWEAVSGATSYLLCVNDVDDPWAGTREFIGNVGDVTQWVDTGYPDDGTTYYWWVWAISECGQSRWIDVQMHRHLFINANLPPAPILVSPVDTAVGGTSVTFTWEPVSGATSYFLCVNDVDNPWAGEREFTGNVGLVTSHEVTGMPNDDTTFYWWVWAVNDDGLSPWSEVQANRGIFINGGPPTGTWSSMTSGTTDLLYSVWGSSSSDVFAVGNVTDGDILHYDGVTWSSMPNVTTEDLHSVWGSSSSDVFAVGRYGTILHYDGGTWSPPMTSGTTDHLYGVWGSSPSDVFAVGRFGTILHYNGSIWSSMGSPTPRNLWGIWGSSSSDVFAVGTDGVILHYDGNIDGTWSSMTNGGTSELRSGVWGSSSSDVFSVGVNGVILYYDGGTWSPMTSGTTVEFRSIWGSSSSDVLTVGYVGTILHYDGGTWSPMTSGTTEDLYGVWGSSSSDVFAVGEYGTILHYTVP